MSNPWESLYYVYALCDPRKPLDTPWHGLTHEPFYIGKGLNGRAWLHFSEAKNAPEKSKKTKTIYDIVTKTGMLPLVSFIAEGLSDPDALALEKVRIREASLDFKMTNGGSGAKRRLNKQAVKAYVPKIYRRPDSETIRALRVICRLPQHGELIEKTDEEWAELLNTDVTALPRLMTQIASVTLHKEFGFRHLFSGLGCWRTGYALLGFCVDAARLTLSGDTEYVMIWPSRKDLEWRLANTAKLRKDFLESPY